MRTFRDRYFVDKEAAQDGNWVDMGDGIKVCVRRSSAPHVLATRRRLENEYAAKRDSEGNFPDAITEEIGRRVMAESIIVNWKGVDPYGSGPLDCTAENVIRVLTDFEDFGNEVFTHAVSRATFQKKVREEDLGN